MLNPSSRRQDIKQQRAPGPVDSSIIKLSTIHCVNKENDLSGGSETVSKDRGDVNPQRPPDIVLSASHQAEMITLTIWLSVVGAKNLMVSAGGGRVGTVYVLRCSFASLALFHWSRLS